MNWDFNLGRACHSLWGPRLRRFELWRTDDPVLFRKQLDDFEWEFSYFDDSWGYWEAAYGWDHLQRAVEADPRPEVIAAVQAAIKRHGHGSMKGWKIPS